MVRVRKKSKVQQPRQKIWYVYDGMWALGTIHRILTNEKYIGTRATTSN
ncbi:recombinase family protein [Lysinibacillus sp. FSL H8-0500]|nr:recombinase family protein [Lysinibacillus macroides]QPR69783.1 recombinase family protein [Lysinibacillus macroides]